MDIVAQIREDLGSEWIPSIYEDQIRPLRTRSFEMPIPAKENEPVVLHTLLGVELKVARTRIPCPDLGTARYLAVFAALGCGQIAVPYDITAIPGFADLLESAWNSTFISFAKHTVGMAPQTVGKTRARLIRAIREEIALIGAGEKMPLFNTSTRQRET